MTGTGKGIRETRSNRPPLPRQVQEHLAQKLRAQLYEASPKPQYLGDPVIPREFDSLIERIENQDRAKRSERIAQIARQAVEEALAGLVQGSRRR